MKQYQNMDLNELEAELKGRLYQYHKRVVRQYIHAKKKLKNPISKYGKPLKESTLKTYRNYVKNIRTERDRYSNMFFKDIIEAIKMRRNGPLFSAKALNKYEFLNQLADIIEEMAIKDMPPDELAFALIKTLEAQLICLTHIKRKAPVLNLDDFRMRRKNIPKAL